MITFLTSPVKCIAASSFAVKRPVHSTTVDTPTDVQSILAGSFSEKMEILFPLTEM